LKEFLGNKDKNGYNDILQAT